MPIRCEIVSQDRLVYEGDVDVIIAPGEMGEMGILPNHAPLLSTLQYGILRVKHGKDEEIFTISGGIIEVQPDIVTVLASAAENVDEINLARAEDAKRRAEKYLAEGPPPDTDAYLRMEAALRRSNLRIEAARRFRKQRSASRIPGFDTGEND